MSTKSFHVHEMDTHVIEALKILAAHKQLKMADLIEWLMFTEDGPWGEYNDLMTLRNAMEHERGRDVVQPEGH